MNSRILEVVPEMNITRIFHPSEDGNSFTIEEQQDVEDLLELNKELAKEEVRPGQELRRVASIPMSLFMQMQQQGITRDPAAMRRWLNDRDNRFFRTTPEKL